MTQGERALRELSQELDDLNLNRNVERWNVKIDLDTRDGMSNPLPRLAEERIRRLACRYLPRPLDVSRWPPYARWRPARAPRRRLAPR